VEWILALLGLLLATIAVVGPIVALVLVIVLWRRVGDLRDRLEALQAGGVFPERAAASTEPLSTPLGPEVEIVSAEVVEAEVVRPTAAAPSRRVAINWEDLIGRKALGWAAVVLLVFAAAFFLRYAYKNNWIGPQGQVAVGILVGLGLIAAGWRYYRRNWRIFSQMLSSAGVVALYLSVYSSFGFYRLVPQQVASAFLLAIIVESALAAVLYRSAGLAWMSLLGGLLTPLLMSSETDQYQAFFIYLLVINVGVILVGRLRTWGGLSTAALLGTHGLFWMWYAEWYHPEKFPWVIGFQLAIYGVFLLLDLTRHVGSRRQSSWEDLIRLLLNAFLWFSAAFVLLRVDYRDWLGLLAVAMAGIYVLLARLALARRSIDQRQLLTGLAAAVGFIALVFPLQADAEWIALGWAAEAAALWWFGLRTASPILRAMAAALITIAVSRMPFVDTLDRRWEPVVPVFNRYALPALGVVFCLLGSAVVARRFRAGLSMAEQILIAMGAIAGVLLLWLVLTVDLYGYFHAQARLYPEDAVAWRWMGQLSVSALWAVYAVAVLAIGFARRVALLRWTALGIFGLTTGKVLLVDMSGLQEIYRILAFFVVAVLLGLAGWAYQRIRLDTQSQTSEADRDETIQEHST